MEDWISAKRAGAGVWIQGLLRLALAQGAPPGFIKEE